MTNEDQIISASVDTFLEKPQFLTVRIKKPKKQTLWHKILRLKPETERIFTIHPCVAANMGRIAGVAVLMKNKLSGESPQEVLLPLLKDNRKDVIYSIAAGIQNDRLEPDPKLIYFLEDNLNAFDMEKALEIILDAKWLTSFFNSIVLITGSVSILRKETSPLDRSE